LEWNDHHAKLAIHGWITDFGVAGVSVVARNRCGEVARTINSALREVGRRQGLGQSFRRGREQCATRHLVKEEAAIMLSLTTTRCVGYGVRPS
jgi:hypothetical protein